MLANVQRAAVPSIPLETIGPAGACPGEPTSRLIVSVPPAQFLAAPADTGKLVAASDFDSKPTKIGEAASLAVNHTA